MANTKIPSELIADNSVGIDALNVTDGTNGQYLQTDGAGTLSFSTVSAGPTFKTFGTSSIMIGDTTTGTINAANYNTGLGVNVFAALTEGDENVMVGFAAGQTLTTGSHNIGIGVNAVDDCSTGSFNVGIGTHAVGSTTTASNNVGVGYAALFLNTTGAENTAVGSLALDANTEGSANVSIGFASLTTNTTGNYNTAVGNSALSVNTASNNVAVGLNALAANTTGGVNTGIGRNAGSANTTGAENTYIGYAAGQNMTAMTVGNRNVVLGAYSAPSIANGNDQIVLGYSVRGTANATITVGNNANTASLSLNGSDTSWAAASSDERLKENIETSKLGLNFINDLRPVNYNWKKAKDVPTYMPQYKEGSEEPVLGYEYGKSQHGFIAQECKAVQDKYVDDLADGFSFWIEKDDGTQTVADGNLIPVLVKAIQELSAKVEELESHLGE